MSENNAAEDAAPGHTSSEDEDAEMTDELEEWEGSEMSDGAMAQVSIELTGDVEELQDKEGVPYKIYLAKALGTFYESGAPDEIIEQALSVAEDALLQMDPNSDKRAELLSDLSTYYLSSFERRGIEEHLVKAHDKIAASVLETPGEDSDRSYRLANHGNVLCNMFELYGTEHDLTSAIDILRTAANDQRLEKNIRAQVLGNYCRALTIRHERFEIWEDLLEAISVAREASQIAEDPSVIIRLESMILTLLTFVVERTKDQENLENAIRFGEHCLRNASDWYHEQSPLYYTMALLYQWQSENLATTAATISLGKAVQFVRDAIQADVLGGSSVAKYHDQLGLLLCAQSALSIAEANSPETAIYSNHLADVLRQRARSKSDTSDAELQRALDLNIGVVRMKQVGLMTRISAGQSCALWLIAQKSWKAASEILDELVSMMPRIAMKALQRREQQKHLGQLTGLSHLAASTALQAGKDAVHAFRILEQGRAIIMSLIVDNPLELPVEFSTDPHVKDLFDRYNTLRVQLSRPWTLTASLGLSTSVSITQRMQGVDDLQKMEDELRSISGLEDFQLPLNDKQLEKLTGSDFVVAYCTTKMRSDAFVVTNKSIDIVRLPALLWTDLEKYFFMLNGPNKVTLNSIWTFAANNSSLQEICKWLWDVAVSPVLAHLGLLEPTKTPTRRMYWLTSGPMSIMPLHAAGVHTDGCTDNTLSHVLSSYTLSAKTLQWSRQKTSTRIMDRGNQHVTSLAVSMPETPGERDLSIDGEVSTFKKCFANVLDLRREAAATLEAALPDVNFAHFACHAKPHPRDPSKGYLCLQSAEDEHQMDPLTIDRIAQLQIPRAFCAYLSACQTADVQSLYLLDEVVHIAGAFQIAGFPHVVGTLWEADDEFAGTVAQAFYRRLAGSTSGGDGAVGRVADVDVALALHGAVVEARQEEPDNILGWGAFVHFGP
ncbi:hypothetical protein MBLNU459_g0790t2 [Dothideomycetes sp. NU459]